MSRPCAVNTRTCRIDLEAFTDHIRKIIQNFRQVAAGFALQHDRGNKKLHVHQRHALGEIEQSVAHRHAELLFFKQLAKFRGDRFADFVGRSVQWRS